MAVVKYAPDSQQQLSGNFSVREFRCPCGCREAFPVDGQLVELLQRLRDHFGKPELISSGYRCPAYNARVGGAKGSYHTQGRAADIWIRELLHQPRVIARYAEELGLRGVGLYENSKGQYFVHLDTRESKSFWEGHAEKPVDTFQEVPKEQLLSVELRVLKKGAKGADVAAMQRLLDRQLAIDGSFGGATDRALRAYQEAQGLAVDGSCGPATWKSLLGRG